MKNIYQITVTPKNITWHNQPYVETVTALTAQKAIKIARDYYNEHSQKDNGSATYKAKLID
jgi:hypothetical protein